MFACLSLMECQLYYANDEISILSDTIRLFSTPKRYKRRGAVGRCSSLLSQDAALITARNILHCSTFSFTFRNEGLFQHS